jgi:Bifunctional DNA primase/polymerase, N-terminal/AAA domain/Primase C terminal 2 (PriCT-2)
MGNSKNNTGVLAAARSYSLKRNWFVFPADLSGKSKKSHKSAKHSNGAPWGMTKDLDEIERDFTKWPDAIGIPTGAENGIFIIETDTKKGHENLEKEGAIVLKELEAKYSSLPPTLMAESPSGSVHYYFKHPGDGIKIVSGTLAPGVDVKGDGGMVVAPPSLRRDGVYRWCNDLPIADPPAWLVQMASKKRESERDTTDSTHPPELKPVEYVLLAEALRLLPNGNLGWDEWNAIVMAIYRATGGNNVGIGLCHQWSMKSGKYKYSETEDRWNALRDCPPTEIGAGTIFHKVDELFPGWRKSYEQRKQEEQRARTQSPDKKLLVSSGTFVTNFEAPEYLFEGMLQQGFCYAFTGPTGSGKTAITLRLAAHKAAGLPLLGKAVDKGTVLYFAGENPIDVQMRWILLCHVMGLDAHALPVHFLPATPDLGKPDIRRQINSEIAIIGHVGLIVVDTSPAYFQGENESDRVQMLEHARMLRSYTNVPGRPTVIANCHPKINYDPENMVPAGGGSFLNELDGNLVCLHKRDSMIAELHHGKLRGMPFASVPFKLQVGTYERLQDSKKRPLFTVTATPIGEDERSAMETTILSKENELLLLLSKHSGLSEREIATKLKWQYASGEPNKSLVHRILNQLEADKLVRRTHDGSRLTKAGHEKVAEIEKSQATAQGEMDLDEGNY